MKTTGDQAVWRWPQVIFGALNLALATPVIYLAMGLPLIMRQHGWSGTEIGIFQLTGLPALFKIIMPSYRQSVHSKKMYPNFLKAKQRYIN